ncbi:putative nucleolar rnase [Phaeomoniella chlamydospora]|uniref:Putative nucleolar rnase n=1 Tax=Phaeomoniella chlamydospora TaxID=158046 RepID=A0A0G2GNR4_PHACM|nr:putative nucleolar rnase [Phaeomoniella chlamydospora]
MAYKRKAEDLRGYASDHQSKRQAPRYEHHERRELREKQATNNLLSLISPSSRHNPHPHTSPSEPPPRPREPPTRPKERTAISKSSTNLAPAPSIKDPKLETAVFTHQGNLSAQSNRNHSISYERLEFIGDAYIELIATRLLWNLYPNITTGRLAQLRDQLVKNETLAEYSVHYGFDIRIDIPKIIFNDRNLSKEKTLTKIKGDIFEAYVAAIILSDPVDGFSTAETWLHDLWKRKLGLLIPDVSSSTSTPPSYPSATKSSIPPMPSQANITPIAAYTNIPSLISQTDMSAKETLRARIGYRGLKVLYLDEKPPQQIAPGQIHFYIGLYLQDDNTTAAKNPSTTADTTTLPRKLAWGIGLNKKIAGNEAASRVLENETLMEELVERKRVVDEERMKFKFKIVAGEDSGPRENEEEKDDDEKGK